MNTINIIFDLIMNIPHAILFLGYNARMADIRLKKTYIISATLICLIINYLNDIEVIGQILRVALNTSFFTVYIAVFIKKDYAKGILFTGLNVLLAYLCEGITFLAVYLMLGKHIMIIQVNLLIAFLIKLGFLCIYYAGLRVLCMLWEKSISKKQEYNRNVFILLVCLQLFFCIIIMIPYFCNLFDAKYGVIVFLCMSVSFLLDILMFSYIKEIHKKELEVSKEAYLAIQLVNQQKRVSLLQKDIQKASDMKCSIQNGLEEAGKLLASQKGGEAKTHLSEITEQIAWKRLYSENRVVDAIVSDKAKECTEKNIRLQTELDIPEKLQVKNAELCVIFANLLDNAIRACERLEGQKKDHDCAEIRLAARERGGYLVIREENPFDGTVEDRKQGPLSEHGLGLGIVEQIAQKHEGRLQTEQAEGKFITTVLLKY